MIHDKSNHRYLLLMVALSISIFFSTFRHIWANIFVALFFLLSLIAAAYSISRNRRQLLLLIALSAIAVIPLWQIAVPNQIVRDTLNSANWLLLTLYVGVMIFLDIIKTRHIGINEIYGVVSVYLLIGIFFGMIYQMLMIFDPNALYFNPTNFKTLPPSDGEIFYYSFVTLSTVGYGDVSPVAPLARSFSIIEAITGVMYVATMIARFIGIHTSRNSD